MKSNEQKKNQNLKNINHIDKKVCEVSKARVNNLVKSQFNTDIGEWYNDHIKADATTYFLPYFLNL